MAEPKRKFTSEFKLEAVRLATTGDKPLAQVARELGILPNLLLERDAARADERREVMLSFHALDLGFVYQHPAFFTFRRFSKKLSREKFDCEP